MHTHTYPDMICVHVYLYVCAHACVCCESVNVYCVLFCVYLCFRCLRVLCCVCVNIFNIHLNCKTIHHAVCAGAGDRPNHYVPVWPFRVATTPKNVERPPPTRFYDLSDEEREEKKATSAPARAKEKEVRAHNAAKKQTALPVCDKMGKRGGFLQKRGANSV